MTAQSFPKSLVVLLAVAGVLALGLTLAIFLDTGVWVQTPVALGVVVVLFASVYSLYRRLKTSEAHYRAIIQRAADGILTADDQGLIETMNTAAEAIFGYRESELIGHSLAVLLSSAYSEAEDGDVWGFLRTNAIEATGRAHEVVGLRRDGEKFFMELSISTARLGDRRVFVVIVRDVTEKKRTQIQLRKARDELEQRVEERTADLKEANIQLQKALAEIKTLSGLIPICASCKKVRDDSGYWSQIEEYLSQHSDAEFSHGICPDCMRALYPHIDPR